jgi:hypothetical protein
MVINTTGWSNSTNEFRTFTELIGRSRSTLNTPHFYVPKNLPITADNKLERMDETKPVEVTQLDDIISHIKARQKTLDVNSLLDIRQSTLQQTLRTNWYLAIIANLNSITVLGILYYSFESRLHSSMLNCFSTSTSPQQNNYNCKTGGQKENVARNVAFTAYFI